MQLKDAIKDTNKKFFLIAHDVPRVIADFLLVMLFILFLPIGYPIAILIRVFKK